MVTLDAVVEKHQFEPPFGLKIDTEGSDLQVIEGATRTLRDTQFVIAEVSVAQRFEGGYSFIEFIEAMDRRDFVLCDILEIARSARSEILFMDALFRKK